MTNEQPFDLIIQGGSCVTPGGIVRADIGVRAGRIAAIGALRPASAAESLDAAGLHVLPGVIDTQVHFREPGLDHKEDLASGGDAAVAGGVTAVFEMPNTKPLTITPEALADKLARATGRMRCDHAFFIGATAENARSLAAYERLPGCAGVKVFMGSSTGDLLIEDDAALLAVLRSGFRRVAVHAEDEPRLRARKGLIDRPDPALHPVWRDEEAALGATARLLRLAREAGRRVHVLHVTTARELELLAEHRDLATVEVTPQHLTLAAPEAYERLGTLAQMNPPLRDPQHRDALWRAVQSGLVDTIGSDHAPHALEEKAKPYPDSPSGMPGVQTLVPVMLDHVNGGRLTIERFVDLTSAGPARLFQMARKGRIGVGYDADFTIVDLKAHRTIANGWIESRCGWTPYDGTTVSGWPVGTMVRGRRVMWEDEITGPAQGEPLRFLETLAPSG